MSRDDTPKPPSGSDETDGWTFEVESVPVEERDDFVSIPPADLPEPSHDLMAEAEAQFEKLNAALESQMSAMEQLVSALGVLGTDETTSNEHVRVTVDATGIMTGLTLTEEAVKLPPDELADRIVETSQAATARMLKKVEDAGSVLDSLRPQAPPTFG